MTYSPDWTARIVATLALALAAGCSAGLDMDTATLAGAAQSAHTEFDGPEGADPDTTDPDTTDGATDPAPGGEDGEDMGNEDGYTADEPHTDGPSDGPTPDRDPEATETSTDKTETCFVSADTGVDGISACLGQMAGTGGTVHVAAGEYVVDKSITVPAGVHLTGVGPSTVLFLDGGVGQPVLTVGSTEEFPIGERTSSVIISNLTINGARDDQPSEFVDAAPWMGVAGISVRYAHSVMIEDVVVERTRGAGIAVDAGSSDVLIRSVEVTESAFDGISVAASSQITISKSIVDGNEGSGISFDWGVEGASVTSTSIANNGYGWAGGENPGIYMAMSMLVVVEGNDIVGNDGNGVVLTNQGLAQSPASTCSSRNTFANNTIAQNGQFGIWLTHTTCVGNTSVGNTMVNNTWGPVFEPVCGQLRETEATCSGAGCPNACATE